MLCSEEDYAGWDWMDLAIATSVVVGNALFIALALFKLYGPLAGAPWWLIALPAAFADVPFIFIVFTYSAVGLHGELRDWLRR